MPGGTGVVGTLGSSIADRVARAYCVTGKLMLYCRPSVPVRVFVTAVSPSIIKYIPGAAWQTMGT